MNSSANFLLSSKKLFSYYKKLIDNALAQIDEDSFFHKHNEESNSIAVIIKHLSGNILSRWYEFRTTDGEKEWRNRDDEFVLTETNMKHYMEKWEKAWGVLWNEFALLEEENTMDTVYIRNEGHTIIEALQRQLTHLSYHCGQIVFLCKLLKNNEWQSLSIPKNKSKEFNKKRFDVDKNITHFTDSL